MGKRITRVEDVIWRQIGDELVVIKDDGLSVHVLNKTAAHIWEMCNGDYQPTEIAASVFERFDVTLEEANADVNELLATLEEKGLLTLAEEAVRP
jgi:hypothetical protein